MKNEPKESPLNVTTVKCALCAVEIKTENAFEDESGRKFCCNQCVIGHLAMEALEIMNWGGK